VSGKRSIALFIIGKGIISITINENGVGRWRVEKLAENEVDGNDDNHSANRKEERERNKQTKLKPRATMLTLE